MHIHLPAGNKIHLHNSEETQLLLQHKSIIKTTQEDQLKTLILMVNMPRFSKVILFKIEHCK